MRLHIKLDDVPEFESYHSMWIALRGMIWSITNTSLGMPLSETTVTELLQAFGGVQDILKQVMDHEEPWLRERQEQMAAFAWGTEIPLPKPRTDASV